MTKNTWLKRCALRFMDKAKMDTGEAARAADTCADLEELTNGAELDLWLDPLKAADDEMERWPAATNTEEGAP